MYVDEVGSDGNAPTAIVATALTALQDNSMSMWRPVFANARKLLKLFCNKIKTPWPGFGLHSSIQYSKHLRILNYASCHAGWARAP